MVTHEQHVMERVAARETGAEEWACPTCGRRLLRHALPAYATTVLVAGDAAATHCGGSGAPRAAQAPADDRAGGGADADDIPLELLRPWLKALKAIEDEGFEAL